MRFAEKVCEACGSVYEPVAPNQRYCSPDCIPCGTYAGWNAHRRRRETPCEACRAAQATYARLRREANPDIYEREKRRDYARERALWKLAEKYPKAYQRLYKAELKQEQS